MRGTSVLRGSLVTLLALASGSGCASEESVIELGRDESAVRMAVSGDALAVGVASAEPYDPRKGVEARSALVLVREGTPNVRAPLGLGFLRDLVPIADGFVTLRVRIPAWPTVVAQVSLVARDGKVTDLPPLALDALGLWVDAAGAIYAYSGRVVMRWSARESAWSRVSLGAGLAAAPITRIVGLGGDRAAAITDRAIIGFTRLEDPPLFEKDMGAYPYPLKLYAGNDAWWLVSSNEREQKLMQVAPGGATREVTTLRGVRVQNVMLGDGAVVIATTGRGSDIHKSFIQVLDPAAGTMGRPRKIPDDTMVTCLWKRTVVSGGPGSRVLRTAIAH